MKALVLEKRDGLAAVLREDGVYVTTAQPCEVGETIELNEKVTAFPRRKKRWLRPAIAAALALVLLSGSYSYLAVSASAYVSLDVGETSVEVSVNRLGRVIAVSPLNEDSAELAQTLNADMRGRKVEDAMTDAMGRFRDDGAFETPDAVVIAGVTSGSEKRGEALTETVERAAREAGAQGGEIMTFDVSRDERREARERDMSGGRYAFEQRGERPDSLPPSETGAEAGATTPEIEPEAAMPPEAPQAGASPVESAPPATSAQPDRPAPGQPSRSEERGEGLPEQGQPAMTEAPPENEPEAQGPPPAEDLPPEQSPENAPADGPASPSGEEPALRESDPAFGQAPAAEPPGGEERGDFGPEAAPPVEQPGPGPQF